MSNYVQSTNFATKDALSSGDPLKIVKGTEINTEFNNIATAVATKADSSTVNAALATKADSSSIPTIATTGEAQAGTDNTKFVTPLRMREGFNASGDAPVYACRAWVNFIGNATPPTILGSGNVVSVTRVSTGFFTVTFTEAMEDVNYSSVMSGSSQIIEIEPNSYTASELGIITENQSFAATNPNRVHVAVFR